MLSAHHISKAYGDKLLFSNLTINVIAGQRVALIGSNGSGKTTLLDILAKCKFVISDSGGLQEEGSFLNKKVIVCRQTTERPEGKSSGHLVMCPSPKKLSGIFGDLINNYRVDSRCPYGDGHSSIKISHILNEL